jgi:hypothetical protein
MMGWLRVASRALGVAELAYRYLDQPSSLVGLEDRLFLQSCEVGSPGFLEFLGSLNPLEAIRKYLGDRHERQKDREYRNKAEARHLHLQNLLLENKVFADRLLIVKEHVPEVELAPVLTAWVAEPLEALGVQSDIGMILPAGTLIAPQWHSSANSTPSSASSPPTVAM